MYRRQSTNPAEDTTRRRGRIVLAVFALALAVMIGRLVQLQIVQHGYWLDRARASQERTIELPPQRGSIIDRHGTLLAIDVKAMAIAVDGININRPDVAIDILRQELNRTGADLAAAINRDAYFTWIDRHVEFDTAQRIRDRAQAAGVYGLIFIDTWKRWYPQGQLASNLIGFVGTDGSGLEGLELALDDRLQGVSRVLRVLEGADGRTYNVEVLEAGARGQDVALTIDANLQFICEEEIRAGVSQRHAAAGMVVLLNPHSGHVLAMAQDKGYDLNAFGQSTAEQRRNLAVTHLFEPGSTFKVVAGLAALEQGVVAPSDTFNGNDAITIAGHTMHNADNVSYGTVTFADIIKDSINTGMVRIAQQLDADAFYDFMVALGIGQPTGVGLPGEERGILRSVDEWSALALAAHSIGQSVAVTALQLARAVSVVATGGLLPQPIITLPEDLRQNGTAGETVCSAASASTMLNLMRRVVESGTGTWAAVDRFAIAGKSGTAQKAIPGQGYVEGKYTSLFAGVIDANAPEYVMLVAFDEIQSGSVSGGYTAGSVFHRVASRLIAAERLVPY